MLELGQWPQTYLWKTQISSQGVLYTLQTLVHERQSLADVPNAKNFFNDNSGTVNDPGIPETSSTRADAWVSRCLLDSIYSGKFCSSQQLPSRTQKDSSSLPPYRRNSPEPELLELSTEQHTFKPRECGMDSNLDARAPTFAQFSKCKNFSNDSNSSTENNQTWLPLNLLRLMLGDYGDFLTDSIHSSIFSHKKDSSSSLAHH